VAPNEAAQREFGTASKVRTDCHDTARQDALDAVKRVLGHERIEVAALSGDTERRRVQQSDGRRQILVTATASAARRAEAAHCLLLADYQSSSVRRVRRLMISRHGCDPEPLIVPALASSNFHRSTRPNVTALRRARWRHPLEDSNS
jgi:hypothetical protein